jgi:hypothetical protein
MNQSMAHDHFSAIDDGLFIRILSGRPVTNEMDGPLEAAILLLRLCFLRSPCIFPRAVFTLTGLPRVFFYPPPAHGG